MKTLIVIGDGLASLSFLYFLNKNHSQIANKLDKIYWITDSNTPACSRQSTAILTLRGTTRGHSDLGDCLVDGYESFVELQNSAQFRSLEKGVHYQLWSDDEPKIGQYRKRYVNLSPADKTPFLKKHYLNCHTEECFLFDTNNFLAELKNEIIKNPIIECLDRRAMKIDQDQKKIITNDQSLHYDYVFLGNGANELIVPLLTPEVSEPLMLRPSSGHYINFYNCSLDVDSFFVTYKFKHISYRKNQKLLQVSTLSIEDYSDEVACEQLKILFHEMKDLFSCLDDVQFEDGICEFGVRLKARKKAPYWGCIAPNIYTINGLFKNGYNLIWSLAPKVVQGFIQDVENTDNC